MTREIRVKARIVEAKTGRVVQKGSITELKKRRRRGSKRIRAPTIGTVSITDTRTGQTTVQRVDTRTGKTLSTSVRTATSAELARVRKEREAKLKLETAAQAKARQQRIKEINASAISKVLSKKQQQQVIRSIVARSTSAQAQLQTRFAQLDARKDLSVLEKQEKKRELLGITTPEVKTQLDKDREARDRFNTLTVAEIKKASPNLLTKIIKDAPLPVLGQSINNIIKTQKLSAKITGQLRALQLKAIEGDQNAKAALIGLVSLPSAAVVSVSELLTGIIELAKNPGEAIEAIANTDRSQINQIGIELGKRGMTGDPKLVTDIGVQLAISGGPTRTLFRTIKAPQSLKNIKAKAENFVFSPDELAKTNKLIKQLEEGTGLTRAQTQLLKDLRLQKAISDQYKFVSSALDKLDSDLRKAAANPTAKAPKDAINKKLDNFDNKIKDANTKQKSIKTRGLTSKKKSELIGKLFKEPTTKKPKEIRFTKTETSKINSFIKAANDIKNRVSRLETKLKSKKISELQATLLRADLNFFKRLDNRISKEFGKLDISNQIKTGKTSKSDAIKGISSLTTNIKKTKKLKVIFDKLNTLEAKIRAAGFKDIKLLRPDLRDRIVKVLAQSNKLDKLSLAQLGAFEKKVTNLLKVSIKKELIKSKFPIKTFRDEIIKGKKLSKLSKSDIEKILSKPNPKTILKDRLDKVNKQISKLENQVKVAKESAKFLDKKGRQSLGKDIGKAVSEIKGLRNTRDKLVKQIKGETKTISQKQIEARAKKFESEIKRPKQVKITSRDVTDTTRTKTIKIGKIEIEVEFNNFSMNKRPRFSKTKGGQLRIPSPQFKFKVSIKSKKEFGAPIDNFKVKAEKAVRRDPLYKKAVRNDKTIMKLDRKSKLLDKKKLTDKQKKQLKKAAQQIKEAVKLQEKLLEKLLLRGLLRATAIKVQIPMPMIGQLTQQLTKINGNINQLENVFKDLERPPIKPPGKPPGKPSGRPPGKPPTRPPGKPPTRPPGKPPTRPPRRPPRGPPPRPVDKPPKKPPILDFDTKLKKGERLKFDYKFREGGKARIVKAGLPLNKALARATKAVDTTTQRSLELVISGITKAKDISKPTRARKFTLRKGKTALKTVEKSKHAIDSKGEKTGLKLSKLLKPKKRKKAVKKTTIKKKKK